MRMGPFKLVVHFDGHATNEDITFWVLFIFCLLALLASSFYFWVYPRLCPPAPPPGVPDTVRERIVSFMFETSATLRHHEDQCAICLDEFVEGTSLLSLPPCGHTFHSDCIGEYMSGATICPKCRENIT
ncbi:hypothetical protein EZV62_019377 [Acer yangbiense]|uniref:RING-type E3 ubiquitin transferase n=1 Tax=Acer yangbiense TaxID=1000413 RepID=A0A5C7HB11_9ROSI|nr:hypothetical protein EZV62_019377 [Acer yangbiense]